MAKQNKPPKTKVESDSTGDIQLKAKPKSSSSQIDETKMSKELIEDYQKRYKQIENQFGELRSYIQREKKDLSEFKEKLEDRLEDQKIKVIEVLGVFISIFTFISVDIQIFKENRNAFILVGFVLVLLSALMAFNLLLKVLSGREIEFTKIRTTDMIAETIARATLQRTDEYKPKLFKVSTWTNGYAVVVLTIVFLITGFISIIIGTIIEGKDLPLNVSPDKEINVNITDKDLEEQNETLIDRLDVMEDEIIQLKQGDTVNTPTIEPDNQ